jgi:TonB family protein
MAVVYRAIDPVADRPLAIKVLRVPDPATEDEILEARLRFQTEVQTLSRLSPHENIPTFYHYHSGEDGEYTYFAMELVQGESLDKKIAAGGARRPDDIVPIIRQIADVLDYAHRKGIIHRDVKPANVLVRPDGAVKIIDFGIARVGSHNLTATGVRLGTPAYMAPEQIRGETVGGPADQFSLAVLAYRLLTGRLPFEGQGDVAMWNSILRSDPSPPSLANPSLPSQLDEVLRRALEKVPDHRFETCGAFAAALESAVFGRIGLASAGATRRTPVSRIFLNGRRSFAAGIAVLAVAVLAVFGVSVERFLSNERGGPPADQTSSVTKDPNDRTPPVPLPAGASHPIKVGKSKNPPSARTVPVARGSAAAASRLHEKGTPASRDADREAKQTKSGNDGYREHREGEALGSSGGPSRGPVPTVAPKAGVAQAQAGDTVAPPAVPNQQKPPQDGPVRIGGGLDPTSAEAFYSRGNTSSAARDYGRAIQDYRQAIRLKPDFESAFYARGNAYYGAKDYDRAVEDYSRAIRLKPDFANAFDARGNSYLAAKDYDRAIQDYGQAIRLNPDFEAAFHNRGNAYREKGDLNRANQDYSEEIRLKTGPLPAPGPPVVAQSEPPAGPARSALAAGAFRVGGGVSQPALIYKVDPEYPEEARRARAADRDLSAEAIKEKYNGTVMLAVVVDTEGHARDIRVTKSLDTNGFKFDEKAIEAVEKWKFKPGEKGGVPVNVRATIEINFRLL